MTICTNDLEHSFSQKVEDARQGCETYDEFETKLVVISQQRALARADIEDEWIRRCFDPYVTRKELAKVTSLEQAISLLSPTLYKISGIKSEKYTLAYVKMWIVDLQSNINVKNKMSESMINICAEAILTQYGHLTIADIKNVFTDALTGVYGDFYESLSTPKILSWFLDYSERRMDACAGVSQSEHYYYKNEGIGWKERERKVELSDKDMLDIKRAKK